MWGAQPPAVTALLKGSDGKTVQRSVSPAADGRYVLSVFPGRYDVIFGAYNALRFGALGLDVTKETTLNFELIYGDADQDHYINLFDFVVLDLNFGGHGPVGDIDGDGNVNLFDYVVIDKHFGAQGY